MFPHKSIKSLEALVIDFRANMMQSDEAVLCVEVFTTQGQKRKRILCEAPGENKKLEALYVQSLQF